MEICYTKSIRDAILTASQNTYAALFAQKSGRGHDERKTSDARARARFVLVVSVVSDVRP
jgi:hypothetical protein